MDLRAIIAVFRKMGQMRCRHVHRFRNALANFWAPVPWLLEASIVLQVVLHKYFKSPTVGGPPAGLRRSSGLLPGRPRPGHSPRFENRGSALNASVRRDGVWKTVPAVRGELVIQLGGVVATDVHLVDGSVLLDQSNTYGESLPIEAKEAQERIRTQAVVHQRRTSAEVTPPACIPNSACRRTRCRTAHVGHWQEVLRIVRDLRYFNAGVILLIGLYPYTHRMPWNEIIPFVSHRSRGHAVALPTTLTLATALGARAQNTSSILRHGSQLSMRLRRSIFCARTRREP